MRAWALLLLGVVPAWAATALAGEFRIPEGWDSYIAQVPRSALIPEKGSNHERKVTPMPRRADTPFGTPRYDVRPLLSEMLGITFAGDAVAYYDDDKSALVAFGPKETLSLIEAMVTGSRCGRGDLMIAVEATLASFECGASATVRGKDYARLRSMAGGSWQELEHFTVTSQSPVRAVAKNSERSAAQAATRTTDDPYDVEPLAPDEVGARFEAEPVVAPDGYTINLNYAFNRHAKDGSGIEKLTSMSSVAMADNSSTVATVWPQNRVTVPGRQQLYALVLHARLVNGRGEPVHEAFIASAEELRQKRKKTAPPVSGEPPER